MFPIVSILTLLILVTASLAADRRLPQVGRLPMRWSMSGRVIRTAPRWFALSFTPLLAACAFIALSFMAARIEGAGERVVLLLAPSFLAAHALHLWLIHRHLGR